MGLAQEGTGAAPLESTPQLSPFAVDHADVPQDAPLLCGRVAPRSESRIELAERVEKFVRVGKGGKLRRNEGFCRYGKIAFRKIGQRREGRRAGRLG